MKRIILILGILMTLESPGATWVPPIGIPEPAFGIKEQAPARPAAWPSAASPGSYYFDSSHPAATDEGNTFGYPDKPRKTIWKYMNVSAGSVTEIHGGPYLFPIDAYCLSINASDVSPPTLANPAFICGFNNAEIGCTDDAFATQNARIEIGASGVSNLIIENIKFTRIAPSIVGASAHHLAIRNCEVSGEYGPCSGLSPSESGSIHDIVYYNNRFHDTMYWDDNVNDWDYHGININTYGRTSATSLYNIWVVDNTFYHCSGDAVQINGNTAGHEAIHHVYIGRNTAHDNRQSGFWSKQASHVIMSQNVIYNMTEHGPQPGNGMGSQYGPDNLWVIFNEVHDCDYGIRQSDTGDGFADHHAYYIGNYIHDLKQLSTTSHWGSPSGWGLSFWSGGLNRHVVDNTIVNVYGGIEMISSGPVYGKGNLIYNLKPNEFPQTFGTYRNHIECGGDGVNVDFVNCLLYGVNGGPSQLSRIKWLGAQYSTLSSAKTALLGKFANCVEANPLLVGVKLQTTSPAIGTGAQSDVYQTFQTLYGIDIRRGFDGGVRPIGAGWDIGACEYNPSAPTIAPPKNPSVVPIPTP